MKKFLSAAIFFILVAVCIQSVQAQEWCSGVINLTNNEQMEATLRYDASTELIQVKTGPTIKVYSPRQVQSFQYFDPLTNSVRQYESHLYTMHHYRKARVFFEVVLAGEMKVLRRFRSWKQARMVAENRHDELWYDSNHVYDYVIYTQNKFVPIRHFQKDILPRLLTEYGDALNTYMKKQRITVFSQRGRLLVINRYNVLKNAEGVARF